MSTFTLPEKKLKEILTLVYIPATQRRMGRKDLERLVSKLRSMHLAVPGAAAYLFHIKCVLNKGGVDRVCLSTSFHCELVDWKVFALQAASRSEHLAEIVRRGPTHLVFCDASGIGAGGVWLDPAEIGRNLVWRHPWPADVTV